jgi:NAD(P)-dependent dehydrogenase (short-subunit alcohol dehydrogenase family)
MAFRVAFVSGGLGGIGKATAHKLASRGISIVLADMNEEEGHQAADDIAKKWSVKSRFVKLDVTQENQVRDAVKAATGWTGRIDYAANTAGICESTWAEEESITTEVFEKCVLSSDTIS